MAIVLAFGNFSSNGRTDCVTLVNYSPKAVMLQPRYIADRIQDLPRFTALKLPCSVYFFDLWHCYEKKPVLFLELTICTIPETEFRMN
jgi:hypothetical protein